MTVNGFQLLSIITKHSIFGVAAVLDPPLELSAKIDFRKVLRKTLLQGLVIEEV